MRGMPNPRLAEVRLGWCWCHDMHMREQHCRVRAISCATPTPLFQCVRSADT
jgi:hypothetical protein